MVEQIRAGGPVTVTDPEIRRYFMLIPEAVELVLQAAVLARHREIFVLDMGEQFKILDLAKNLIRLSGFVPEEEIPITFVGLRPGEKLVEELVGLGEALEPSEISKVFRVRATDVGDAQRVGEQVDALVRAAVQGDVSETIALLTRVVPTFTRPAPAGVAPADGAVVRTARSRAPRPAVLTPVPPPPASPARLAVVKPQA
jgi:FlaA1/EpsC-like NDP-sugar epimerase